MSKANSMTSQFLTKAKLQDNKEINQFKSVQYGPQNSFRNTFQVVSLKEKEANAIEQLLIENHNPGLLNEKEPQIDCDSLKNLTAEIKAITKQGIILLGERIQKARTILKKYGDGQRVFTQWLLNTFGNRRSAYNTLSYYEFYQSLPEDSLKHKLKSMPVQAVYTLASREGSIDVKKEIITNYDGEKQRDTILLIQERLPLDGKDKRKKKESIASLLEQLKGICQSFEKNKELITEEHMNELGKLSERLEKLSRC